MKTTLILLGFVVMAAARGGVNVVDNNPEDGRKVNFVDNTNGVNAVDNNQQDIPFVDNGNVDSFFNQPSNPLPPNGGYEPIDNKPAFVENDRPKKFDNPLLRGGN